MRATAKKVAEAALDILNEPLSDFQTELQKAADKANPYFMESAELLGRRVKQMMEESLATLHTGDKLDFDLKDLRQAATEMASKTRTPPIVVCKQGAVTTAQHT